ncbi:SDR family NAD(P)-dependent oxidoreductase, partial [Paraburkholderia sp. SIMBA_030]
INYQSDESAAQSVLEQVRALGAQAIAVRADVSIEDEVIAMFRRVDAELGRVTALVNNAGTVGHKSRVDEMSEFRILKILKTNVLAPILCAKH